MGTVRITRVVKGMVVVIGRFVVFGMVVVIGSVVISCRTVAIVGGVARLAFVGRV